MTAAQATRAESRAFEADVAKLLHLMVHAVYSDKAVFLRELISNAADAYEKLRYDAIANPALLGDDPRPRITLSIDPDKRTLTVHLGDLATPAHPPGRAHERASRAAPRR